MRLSLRKSDKLWAKCCRTLVFIAPEKKATEKAKKMAEKAAAHLM